MKLKRMILNQTLTDAVDGILGTAFEERDGKKIPTSDDIALSNGAVKLDAAFLYADLAGSGLIAKVCLWNTTANVPRQHLWPRFEVVIWRDWVSS